MATSTATTRTLPTPPPVPSFPLRSPSKKDSALKPNPHPYAIKTTSTGILTRSNSSGFNVNATHHFYIPPSPIHSRTDSKGHRSSKSLTAVPESPSRESPRPLPIPPELDHTTVRRNGSGGSGGYVSADEVSLSSRRPKRAETLPTFPLSTPTLSAPPSVDDLPENPKLWTPSQLAIYLTTALRMTSNGKPGEIESIGLPPLVAKDIASFVKGARIGGRVFLRLNEDDLDQLGMNKKWRDALLTAARNLRQNLLKGRIWAGTDSPPSPSPQSASPPSKIFSDAQFNSSSSSIESSSSLSVGEDADASVGMNGAALGRSKARRYRSGRVRGMVETFERSGSFSSDGGLDDTEGNPSEERSRFRTWSRQEAQFTGQRVTESPSPTRQRPLPIPPSPSGSQTGSMVDDEPTMEVLLAQLGKTQPPHPMSGAEAWEAMDLAAGVTVKRIPEAPILPDALVGPKTIAGLGSGRSSGGSSKGKSDRRVVTAIFAPTASVPPATTADTLKALEATAARDALAEPQSSPESRPLPTPPSQPQSRSQSPSKGRPLPPTPGEQAHAAAEPSPDAGAGMEPLLGAIADQTHLERMLEEEILATHALLATFRARLEVVEGKVADLEALEQARAEREEALTAAATAPAPPPRMSVEVGVQAHIVESTVAAEMKTPSAAALSTVAPAAPESDVSRFAEAGPGSLGLSTSESTASVSASAPPSQAAPSTALASTSPSAPAPSTRLTLQSVIPDVMRRLQAHTPASLFSTSNRAAEKADREADGEDASAPAAASGLSLPSSYVLFVGLGVCAVVAQVVLRKVVSKGGLRP